jgi:two-component system response regulator MprA
MPMPKILVVDDEKRIADIIDKFLTINGFDVMKTVGGEEAIEVLVSDAPIDMMLLDMKMPKVDGMDVIRKKEELGRKFPVLLLTGSVDAERFADELKEKGFREEDILYKPVDLPVLLEKVKKKLGVA